MSEHRVAASSGAEGLEPTFPAMRRFLAPSGATLDFSALGFGCAPLGNLYRAISEQEARAALEAAWEVGCRYFDTAPWYGLGLAECRLNSFLRDKRDRGLLLSTKVGRVLVRSDAEGRSGRDAFFDVPCRRVVFDYSYDGVMRSVEQSFERLGVDAVDILMCHDVDVTTHGSAEASDARMSEFMEGGYRALVELRAAGATRAIGAGLNDWEVAESLARRGEFDLFLLAGRYTLLEQPAAASFLPYCSSRGIGVVIGGPFNSGILATGARPGARYNYAPADEHVLERVRRLEKVCGTHGVPLPAAALAFVLAHPAVVSVVPGGASAAEICRNAQYLRSSMPPALWSALKSEGLLNSNAPVPTSSGTDGA